MRMSAPYRFGSIRANPPLAFAGQRIGLLGGSFNPPHEAHLLISEIALKRIGLDRVWWIVTPGNPLKSGSGLAPLAERMRLCREMAVDRRIVVTAFEQGLPSRYTAATIAFLRARRPGVRFVWLMGADCLAEFHRWKLWREMLETMPAAVIDRPGWHFQALASPAGGAYAGARLPEARARLLPSARAPAWTFLSGPLSAQSSTAIRAASRGI